MASGRDAKEVVGTGRATQQQYQPRRLQVRHGKDTLQECVLGRAFLRLCGRVAAERGPEDNQALLVGWQGQVAHPAGVFGGPEGIDALWQHAAGVPSASLPQVDLDAGMRLQTRLQDVKNGTRTAGPREDIDVIQEGEEDLPWQQHGLCGLQSWVLRERKQARHQRVALFAPFALLNDMRRAVDVVEGAHPTVRQHSLVASVAALKRGARHSAPARINKAY